MSVTSRYIVYNKHGVCEFLGETVKSAKTYCILKPLYDKETTLYLPKNNQELMKKIRPITTLDDIEKLINLISITETLWITNNKIRKEKFKEVLYNNNQLELLKLIKTIYLHKEKLKNTKKKISLFDEMIFKEAEKKLYNELAITLKINPNEVSNFIKMRINEMGTNNEIRY